MDRNSEAGVRGTLSLPAVGLLSTLLLSVTVCIVEVAQAAPCPYWASPDAPIIRQPFNPDRKGIDPRHGPLFTDTAYFWVNGIWFEYPFGYRNPWPSRPFASIRTDKDLYMDFLESSEGIDFERDRTEYDPLPPEGFWSTPSFVFWMPSLRYVERNFGRGIGFRPCEAGRPRPTDDEYLVWFTLVWPFLPGSGESDAARGFRAEAERLAKGEPLAAQNISSWEHSQNGPISGKAYYKIYEDDGDLVVSFLCTPHVLDGVNPICRGLAWRRSSDLILNLSFPSSKGMLGTQDRWRAPVEAATALVNSWRQ